MPSQPNINRGTLILLAPNVADASISSKNIYFVFQYNPEKLIHSFNQAASQALAANTPADSQVPSEYFNLTFDLDSVDVDPPPTSAQSQAASDLGLHPALAMLELMMQPQTISKQTVLPIVIFKWGAKRQVAVRVVSMNVEENAFDLTLNPVRASVSLTLRVLDASEISSSQGAKNVSASHQNTRMTLVDAYKLQTGQGTIASGTVLGAAAAASSTLAAGGTVAESKTKASA